MDMKEIRLKNMLYLIRSETNSDQSLFCEIANISKSEVSQIKNLNNPRNIGDNLARRIESAFNKPKYWMDKDRSSATDIQTKDPTNVYQLGAVETWDSKTPLSDNEVEVKYYMEVELAAGCGFDSAREVNGPTLRFNKGFLKRKGVLADNAACVKVVGNSMEPRLYSGDVVAVDCGTKNIIDGDTYAINHDGLLRIKRLYLMPGGGLRINSFNSDEHPDEVLDSEQRKLLNVIGRVFHSISDW